MAEPTTKRDIPTLSTPTRLLRLLKEYNESGSIEKRKAWMYEHATEVLEIARCEAAATWSVSLSHGGTLCMIVSHLHAVSPDDDSLEYKMACFLHEASRISPMFGLTTEQIAIVNVIRSGIVERRIRYESKGNKP